MTDTTATDPLAIGAEVTIRRPGSRRAQTWVITAHGDAAQDQDGMIFGRLPNRQFPGDFRSNERFLGERADLLAEIGQ